MDTFNSRFLRHRDELEWLYMELYDDRDMLDALEKGMEDHFNKRKEELKALDEKRLSDSSWYLEGNMLGMTMYTELFAGTFKKLKDKVAYLKDLHITYLHLMPFLKTPKENNDGGFAVSDFNMVDPKFGSNKDLEDLADELRKNGISLCMDMVMNHTSSEHEWAQKAINGDPSYQNRYLCFPDRTIPDEYEKTCPEVFPESAPGNFTYSPKMGKWVFTSFYPTQWDLNYKNPAVFNDMVFSMLLWANQGIEIFRLDAVPYIWKEIGTNCRNLKQVHTIVRMIRMILEIVCPAVILKGEVVMAPKELAAYFGTKDKPECHLLYGVASMVNIWGALSSRDVRLLEYQTVDLLSLGQNANFVNYLRCHDDIGWGFDEQKEPLIGADPLKHKIFQYEFYQGRFPGSFSRGELYNYDPKTFDARSCGTTASLCGIEKALKDKDEDELEAAIARYRLIYATAFFLRGFPLLNSGDEIGQLNDYSYKEDELKKDDSRYLHRSKFDWKKAQRIKKEGTLENRLYGILEQLYKIRAGNELFCADAEVSTWDSGNRHVFALRRKKGSKVLLCLFNYSPDPESVAFNYFTGYYTDMLSKRRIEPGRPFIIEGYGCMVLEGYWE